MTSHHEPRPAPHNKLAEDLLNGLDSVFGMHPGFRAVHAKGLMCRGVFNPAPEGASLTRAPHIARMSTPVVVRLSDFAGVPTVPDNDPAAASPRGMAIRFYLAEHVHTDIVAHSFDGFPTRNGEDFLKFVRALAASGPTAPKPTLLDEFLLAHPAAMRFAVAPKPIPTSFAREAFFGVSALKFTNRSGSSRFGRYRIRPEAGTDYLSAEEASRKSSDFLIEEFSARLQQGPVKFHVSVQLAEPGDDVNDPSTTWPDGRSQINLGTIALSERVDDQDAEFRKIIFDPIPRVDGLEPSDDPLWQLRADLYLLSGRRRRAVSS
ncbi:MAG TPA: catalase family peroxidase [Pirellulales bacterium]